MTSVPRVIFDLPWLLLGALILPLCVWLLRRVRARQRRERLGRYAEPTALRRLVPFTGTSPGARTARLVSIAVLAGIALAGPRWGLARGPSSARGIDMAVALDASLSMTATDERPSRLERMKQEVRRLRSMSRADRVALMAFAGRSYILTPLTTDDGALELYLDNLDPSVVGQAGSSIARTIRQGTELLLASDGSADRALVVMTDGEVFESAEDVVAAAREAGSQGISLVTVGFGTERGSTIPVRDGSVIREKRDADGKVVVTKYNPDLLRQAAEAAGGTFIAADASDKATRVRAALRSLRTARRTVDSREDHVPRFLWALVPALLLLLYDTWAMTRRIVRAAPVATVPVTGLLLLWVSMAGCARPPDPARLYADGDVKRAIAAYRLMVAEGDTSAMTRYNLGTALIAVDSLTEAVELLEAVRRSTDGELRMRARYNAGLAQLLIGRAAGNPDADRALAAARAAYRALLQDRATDADAKWNFELALRHPPPNSGGGGGGGGGNDAAESPSPPQGSLDQRQAEALLNSAAREERDVQGRKQQKGRVPPVGKDW
ncbi:MAG: VWA domain-containing protein [Gemmatimonadaceae bacterium]|nr:VWA domain-containing protein [Gemmatimonadaceae bacterium]